MDARRTTVERNTKETQIKLTLHLDQTEPRTISTPVPFFSHMLDAFACHGRFGLELEATGDVDVDPHHLMEDTGIVLGEALRQALGDHKGIERAGCFSFAMDGTLTNVALDLCGRPTLVWRVSFGPHSIAGLDPNLFRDFYKGLADSAKMALHIHMLESDNDHHVVESVMKGFGRALRHAVTPLPGGNLLSTKGMIDA